MVASCLHTHFMDPTEPAAIEERVRMARIRLFFEHTRGNMAGVALGSALTCAILAMAGAAAQALWLWGGLMVCAMAAVHRYQRQVALQGICGDNAAQRLRTRTMLGGVVAALWGASGFLMPGDASAVHNALLFVVLSTMVTIGALGYAAMPSYYFTLSVLSLVPLTLHFALQAARHQDGEHLMLALVSLIWQAAVLRKAGAVSRTVIEGIRINERLRTEVEEHRQTREAMRLMAQRDALTGLANRALFSDRLQQTLTLAQRSRACFALLYLDLDHFKPVNDTLGHAVGDQLLVEVARRIEQCVRESDTVGRIGGDEFMVLLNVIEDGHSAIQVAEKIRGALARPWSADGAPVTVACSIGVALYPDHGQTEVELARAADAAMYRAKHAGRNRVASAVPGSAKDFRIPQPAAQHTAVSQ